MSEDDLYDVDGWLLFYAVIRIGLAAAALIFVGVGIFATQTSIPYLRLIPVLTGLAAGICIVRTSTWAIPAVALDMAVSLAFFVTTAFQGDCVRQLIYFKKQFNWLSSTHGSNTSEPQDASEILSAGICSPTHLPVQIFKHRMSRRANLP